MILLRESFDGANGSMRGMSREEMKRHSLPRSCPPPALCTIVPGSLPKSTIQGRITTGERPRAVLLSVSSGNRRRLHKKITDCRVETAQCRLTFFSGCLSCELSEKRCGSARYGDIFTEARRAELRNLLSQGEAVHGCCCRPGRTGPSPGCYRVHRVYPHIPPGGGSQE